MVAWDKVQAKVSLALFKRPGERLRLQPGPVIDAGSEVDPGELRQSGDKIERVVRGPGKVDGQGWA
jgi:hypothetical protein